MAPRDSSVEQIEIPTFKPTVPHFLTTRLTEQELAILEALSTIEQQSAWYSDKIVRSYTILKSHDERILDLEDIRNTNNVWFGKASLGMNILTTVCTVLAMTLLPKLFTFIFHL